MPPNPPSRDVAIVGYACKFAGANDLESYWQNLRAGRTSFTPIPADRWNADTFYAEHPRERDKTYVKNGAFIDGVDQFAAMHFGISPRRVEGMDPQHRLILDSVRIALQDAGLEDKEFDRSKVGTFLGLSTSEYRNIMCARTTAMLMADGTYGEIDENSNHVLGRGVENIAPISAFSISGMIGNMTAANVANHWKFGGPAFTIDAACASSLVAVADAVQYIRAGVCDLAIAGGVYTNLTPENLIGFSRIGAISRSGQCRPFDVEADGFLQGDGVGVVVLKRLDLALADGDRIHAVIKGVGINNDGGDSPGPMAPSVAGQVDVLRTAYRDADIDPKTVGFVECHGTATAVGDVVEVEALHEAFGQTANPVFISSVKANIGHTMSTAGIAGFIHAILNVEHKEITPQAGFTTANPALLLEERGFAIPRQLTPWESTTPRRAGVSAFGFGGTNCHVVIEEAPAQEAAPAQGPQHLVLSAPNRELLASHVLALANTIETQDLNLSDVALTLNTTRRNERVRLGVVAHDAADLIVQLRELAPRIEGATTLVLSPDAFLAEGEAPELAFMFPGQGAQRVGLLKDLYDVYPAFRGHLDKIAAQVDDQLEKPLLEYLYATPSDAAEDDLRATEICQPAMAALGLALDRFFGELGIRPSVTLGHSLGEFVAAAAGGLLSHEDAMRFVTQRGRLMATLPMDDFGAMAAVMAAANDVRPQLRGSVCVANINHPMQTVVAGPTLEIDEFVEACTKAGVKATRLNVSHAFHSSVVAPVAKELQYHINAISFQAPAAKIASAITGELYAVESAPRTFADHATTTVDFVKALELAAEHAQYFLELGAGTTLTTFANGALKDHRGARNVAAKKPDGGVEFQRTLAALRALGISMDTTSIQAGRLVTLPATPLETQRYWGVRDQKMPLAITPDSAPSTAQPAPEQNSMEQPSESLIALFRQQNDILQQHAALLAKQMEALGFTVEGLVAPSVPSVMQSSPVTVAVDTVAPKITQAPVQEDAPTPAKTDNHADVVLDAIAAVSAFPRDSLKQDQVLAAELGFDSLMFVDLGTQLTKALPGLVIPVDAFNSTTSIGDVIALLSTATNGPTPTQAVNSDSTRSAALSRYEVKLSNAPLPTQTHIPEWIHGTVAISTDSAGVALGLAQRLIARGVSVALFGTMRAATKVVSYVADSRAQALQELLQHQKNVQGVVYLVEGDDEAIITIDLHETARALESTAPKFFVTSGDLSPAHAAAGGFTKSLAREWTSTQCSALTVTHSDIAQSIEAELFSPLRDIEVFVAEDRKIPRLIQSGIEQPVADWRNQIVLVTGGSRGIGKMIAEKLVELGARVVTTGRQGKATATESLAFVPWDCTEPADEKTRKKLAIFGQFNAVIHSAGLIRDGLVGTKSATDIQHVIGVKTVGLKNALEVASEATRIASFSSWAGRFGNRGQADYAAANETMRALTTAQRSSTVEAITFDWPAWDGTDMVASIPAAVRAVLESNGVTFMTPEEGLDAFFAEWGMGAGEVVFGRELPEMERHFQTEFEASLTTLPWVQDHRLRDTPVLPFAFALDVALQACAALGATTASMNDFELLRGVEVDAKTHLEVKATRTGGAFQVEIFAKSGDQKFLAYRGNTDLNQPDLQNFEADELDPKEISLGLNDFYKNLSFHGPAMQGIAAINNLGGKYSVGTLKNHVLQNPMGAEIASPFVVDASFQMVLYWLRSQHGAAAYPTSMGRYVQFAPFPEQTRCTLMLQEMQGDIARGSIRFDSMDGKSIALMQDVSARIFERAQTTSAPEKSVFIDESHWKIEKFPEVEALKQRLEMAFLVGLRNPYFHWHDGIAKNTANIEGQDMINFSSYNYLGFSGHPEVTKAAQDAITRYGTSVSASRVASGEIPLHHELEHEIAEFIGVDNALVFSAGHHANESVIGHLFGEGDLIIHDSLAHNSIMTGAEMSGAKRMPFPHNDWKALDRILTQLRGAYQKVGIMIEGVYSMDGDIPDLEKFLEIKEKHHALLYVDEAHSIGCIGPRGAGISDYFGIDARRVDVWMGTLSKSFASCGGYIAGSAALIEYLKYTVPGFVFSAGISPANSAAALKACQLMKSQPETIHLLQARSKYFLECCQNLGLDTGPSHDSAVVPCIVGNSFHALQLSDRLSQRGINVQPIVYPAVDDDAARLRFFLSSTHTEAELESTAKILSEELALVREGAAAE